MKKKKLTFIPPEPPERILATAEEGLTQEQARQRLEDGWANTPVTVASKTLGQIIRSNLFTYFNLIFAILGVLVFASGSLRNLTFLPLVVANLLIGIIQEIRAKNTLDKLSMLNAPRARVIRDGQIQEIPAEELVLDDIVLFRAGDQICADAIILDGEVLVNEALLTGEADELKKGLGDFLMSGSFLVSGECTARLERVGAESYISQLTLEAKATDTKQRSEMLRTLDRLVGVVGILIVPIGIFLFVQQYVLSGASFRDSVLSMVAAVLGMIPEGLYLLTSVALVVSVLRLATRKVLVHDMKCIEALARVDVLCVDKTGTITENEMQVSSLVPLEGFDPAQGVGLKTLVGNLVAVMPEGNQTMQALHRYFKLPAQTNAEQVFPFSSTYKYCGAVFSGEAYVLGAPEFLLREDYEAVRPLAESFSGDGYRVMLFGKYTGTLEGLALTEKVIPLGLILLTNPIRRDAPETFRYFAQQGVAVKVISGDNPLTVSRIAMEAEISGAEKYIDASTLDSEEAIYEAAGEYTVFGRVTPDQKRQLVRALQSQGHTVAMTGDGVNDVLALKDADCSVAMASGCDAAAQVSQLVLLESDFSAMPSVVAEGRRVVNNVQRSASLFLVKNIFSFLLSVFSACFMIRGKFLPNVLAKALPAGLTDFLVVGALVIFGRVFGVNEGDISIACTMLLSIVGFMILYNISKPLNWFRWIIWGGCVTGLLVCSIWLGDIFGIGRMSLKCVLLFGVFAIATEPILRYGILLTETVSRLHRAHREKRLAKKAQKAENN